MCLSVNTWEAVRVIKNIQEGESDNTTDTGSSSAVKIKHLWNCADVYRKQSVVQWQDGY